MREREDSKTMLMSTDINHGNTSLCEALDRILNKGAVVIAEITISVSNVDLIHLSLQAILTSIDPVEKSLAARVNSAAGITEKGD